MSVDTNMQSRMACVRHLPLQEQPGPCKNLPLWEDLDLVTDATDAVGEVASLRKVSSEGLPGSISMCRPVCRTQQDTTGKN